MQKINGILSLLLIIIAERYYMVNFTQKETSWTHIEAAEYICQKYGIVFSYYVDCYSIFRFVQGRDSFWRKYIKVTDEADPQFKQVLDELSIKLIYALSVRAKGKIERPYSYQVHSTTGEIPDIRFTL